jgi:sensor histidine kinase YesM
MGRVRQGRLTGYSPPAQKDELGVIQGEFLSVCDSLDAYIQREYVYQIKQKEMEFYALQAQVDPHFLYNTLEAIRMKLLLAGEREASRVIRILSEMFRNIMRKDTVVDLRDEIRHLRDYLELYRFCMGDRLEYAIDVDEDVFRFASVRHILQPIIENALVHGFRGVASGQGRGTWKLILSARLDGGDIHFTITDNGAGIPPQLLREISANLESDSIFQQSVGIYNVNSRLRIAYGQAYRLRLESSLHEGTTVHLRIKAKSKKEVSALVQGADRG